MPDSQASSETVRDARFRSGTWKGYFLVRNSKRRHPMELVLTFANGVVDGVGTDSRGFFTVQGRYDVESLEVTWTRAHPGQKEAGFRGFREGRGIWGVWSESDGDGGGFMIWPEAKRPARVV